MSHHRRQFLAGTGSVLGGLTGGTAAASSASLSGDRDETALESGQTDEFDWIAGVNRQWSVPARRESPPIDPERRLVYVGHDNRVSAYDLEQGALVWEQAAGGRQLTLAGETLLVYDTSTETPVIRALDPDDGRLQWSDTIPNGLLSAPTVHAGRLYLETSVDSETIEHPIGEQRTPAASDIEAVGRVEARSPDTGEVLWQAEQEGQLRVESTIEETVVLRAVPSDWIHDDEAIYAVDTTTGALRWQQTENVPTKTYSPGDVLYCTHPSNSLLRARKPRNGELLWVRTGDIGPAVRAAQDGTAVITRRSGVLAIDESTGTVEWTHDVGDYPQPVDAMVDTDRNVVYAATRDRPAYLASGGATESATVMAWELDTGERRWARTCPYYSSGRLALGADAVYVRNWRGTPLESGCTALDPETGDIQFRSAIDGTRFATPPDVADSPALVVGNEEPNDTGSDSLQLHALSPGESTQSPGSGGEGAPSPEVVQTDVVSIEHTETIGIAVTLETEPVASVTIRLTSADGSQSTTLTNTAVTEQTEAGRLQTASLEEATIPFSPAVCEIDTGVETVTVDIE